MAATVFVLTCLIGAIIPGFGSELALATAASLSEGTLLVLLVVVSAAAQAIGKLVVYGAAAAGAHAAARAGRGVNRLQAAFARSPGGATALVFTSALASIPPLFATTIACGAARHGTVRFGVTVFVARMIRYASFVLLLDSLTEVLR